MAEKIRTAIWQERPVPGHPFCAERTVCHGYDFEKDLLGQVAWDEMAFLLLRGRRPSAVERKLWNVVLVGLSNPGPREWSTRAAMGAAVGKAAIGNCLMAGLAVQQGRAHGSQAVEEAMRWMQGAREEEEEEEVSLPPGYGWWFTGRDTRAVHLLKAARAVRKPGPHTRLALRMEARLAQQEKGWLTLDGATAALLLDLGFTPEQGGGAALIAAVPGLLAHSLEQWPKRWNEYPVFWREDRYFYQPPRGGRTLSEPPAGSRQERWERLRGRVFTSTGKILPGRRDFAFLGFRQFRDLTGHVTWMQHLILSVRGRLPSRKQARFIEALAICTNYGDPRLWMHQAAGFAANLRAPQGAALAAGLAALEGERLGPRPMGAAAQFLANAGTGWREAVERKLERREIIFGYGRPLVQTDERIPVAMQWARRYGYDRGRHVKLAFRIERYLKRRKGIVLNVGGLIAAFLLDFGFTPQEVYLLSCNLFTSGIVSSIWEQSQREPGTFLPMACDDIEYVGPKPRGRVGRPSTSSGRTGKNMGSGRARGSHWRRRRK